MPSYFDNYVKERDKTEGERHEKYEIQIRNLGRTLQEEREDKKKCMSQLTEILPKLIKIRVCRDDDPQLGESFRLVTEFRPELIREAFIHGNSNRLIEYIGEDIGYRVAYELRTMNFQRFRG